MSLNLGNKEQSSKTRTKRKNGTKFYNQKSFLIVSEIMPLLSVVDQKVLTPVDSLTHKIVPLLPKPPKLAVDDTFVKHTPFNREDVWDLGFRILRENRVSRLLSEF